MGLQRWAWVEKDAQRLLARMVPSLVCWVHKAWPCVLLSGLWGCV